MTPQGHRTGGLRAALFVGIASLCLSLSLGASAQTVGLALHEQPVWQALLHLRDGQPQIRDRDFLLSLPEFSPRRELEATLAVLGGPDRERAVCRFPARYAWLRAQGALPEISEAGCGDWQEFRRRAPLDALSVVFASENLAQPASVMGHLFLKVDSRAADGRLIEHAVSFYTDTGSLNLPRLLYESLVTGKDGYFLLRPFQEELNQYTVREQRSLWRYELQLDAVQRARLQAHIHELRQTRITYLFQDYNCATLVRHLLAVAEPGMLEGAPVWTTPKDVLRQAEAIGLVREVVVQAPSLWQVRALRAVLPRERVDAARRAVDGHEVDGLLPSAQAGDGREDFLTLQLARAYLRYQVEQGQIDAPRAVDLAVALQTVRPVTETRWQLDTDVSRDPARAPPERQLGLGWRHEAGADQLQLSFLPVSHALADDNRQNFVENEMRLFESRWLLAPRTGRMRLDALTIYAVQSLLPQDPLTGGLSGRLRLAVDAPASTEVSPARALMLDAALGRTWRVVDDLDTYALLGGTWAWRGNARLSASAAAGVVVREVWDMKTLLEYRTETPPLGAHDASRAWRLTQSLFLGGRDTLRLAWQRVEQGGRERQRVDLSYHRLY